MLAGYSPPLKMCFALFLLFCLLILESMKLQTWKQGGAYSAVLGLHPLLQRIYSCISSEKVYPIAAFVSTVLNIMVNPPEIAPKY